MADTQWSWWNRALVEEAEHPAGRRHVDHPSRAKGEEDPALDPMDRAPRSLGILSGRAHVAGFETVEHTEHDVFGVRRQRLAGGNRRQFLDPRHEIRRIGIVGGDRCGITHHTPSTPAAMSAACTADALPSLSGTSGSLSTFSIIPIIASAAFAGIGFGSTKAAAIHGCSLR